MNNDLGPVDRGDLKNPLPEHCLSLTADSLRKNLQNPLPMR